MPFKVPAYPAILTDADWQKKKGNIAKIAGKTGIGDLMDKASSAYRAIEWKKFQLGYAIPSGKAARHEDVETAYQDALKEGSKVKALNGAVKELEKSAKDLAAKWKSNKLIPAASAKHAQAVSDAAKDFADITTPVAVSTALQDERKECDDGIDKLLEQYAKLNDKLRKYVNNFEAEAGKTTLEDYASFWKEHIRGVGTVLPTLIKDHPELDGEWKIWKQFSNSQNTPKDQPDFEKQMKILVAVSKQLKPKLAHI